MPTLADGCVGWRQDAAPDDRRALAVTLFERIGEVGVERVWAYGSLYDTPGLAVS